MASTTLRTPPSTANNATRTGLRCVLPGTSSCPEATTAPTSTTIASSTPPTTSSVRRRIGRVGSGTGIAVLGLRFDM